MSINLERKIQDSIITLLEAESFVITNEIDVRDWFNPDEEIEGRQIIVHANPAIPSLTDENGEAQEWSVSVDTMGYTHNTQDTIIGTQTIYEFLLGWVRSLTKAQIQTATSLNVTGKWIVESGEQYDDRFRGKISSFEVYCNEV